MKLSIFLDPQEGMTWAAMLAAARRTEAGGFEGLYRSDHLAPTSGRFERAATEAWTTLAALAGETSRLRLGTLITPFTFREPSVLAKMVSTVCEMAPGRIDVSIGTGWNVGEHEALGLTFESLGHALRPPGGVRPGARGLWGDEPFTLRGRALPRRAASSSLPLPEPRPRLIIGGHGNAAHPRLAARYADDYNVDWPSVEQFTDLNARVDEACRETRPRPCHAQPLGILLGVIVGEDAADVRAAALRPGWPSWAATMPTPGWQSMPPAGSWDARPDRRLAARHTSARDWSTPC